MRSKQKNTGILLRGEDAFALRRLNVAFLRTMIALKRRPEPRWRFDAVAAGDSRRNHPGEDAVQDCRTVLAAAVATRDRDVVNRTRREIAHYFDAMKAEALREIVLPDTPSLTEAVKAFTREAGEAQHAVVCAAIDKSESSIETALREVREMDNEGERMTELLEASIQQFGRREMAVIR